MPRWTLILLLALLLAACAGSPTALQPSPTTAPSPAVTTSLTPSPPTPAPTPTAAPAVAATPSGPERRIPSPDGRWAAVLNTTVGSLGVEQADGKAFGVFAPGSTVNDAVWAPDSRRLLVVKTNYLPSPPGTAVVARGPIEIWRVDVENSGKPTRLFQSRPISLGRDTFQPDEIILGHWSPDNRLILVWLSPLVDNADGMELWVLNVETGAATRLAATALQNPGYQSWAPDSSALAFTAGGYRSAQVNKWLDLFHVASGQVTTVVGDTEQIPGIVAWSPRGDLIAYAAVSRKDSDSGEADYMGFDNPAILKRRVFLLDPKTGEYRRLNQTEAFQDAPVWSDDDATLYYVQREGDEMALMAANPAGGTAQVIEGTRRPAPDTVGYYGQSDWSDLLAHRPTAARTPTAALMLTPGVTDCVVIYPGLPGCLTDTPLASGRLAFVLPRPTFDGQPTVIDLKNGGAWRLDGPASGLVFSPSGDYVLSTLGYENGYSVSRYDDGEPQYPFPTSLAAFWAPSNALSGAQDWLASSTGEGALLATSFPGGATRQVLPPGSLGQDGRGVAIWSEGGRIAWTLGADQMIQAQRREQILFVGSADGTGKFVSWRLSPDISQAYYLPVAWAAGTSFVLAAKAGVCNSCLSWGVPLVAINADTGNIADLHAAMFLSAEAYAWSPKQPGVIALAEGGSRYRFDGTRLLLLDLTNGKSRYLTGPELSVFEPAWSPDASLIAYEAVRASLQASGDGEALEHTLDGRAIYVANPESGETRVLTHPGKAVDSWPHWTGDGTRLLYTRKFADHTDVRVVSLDGTLDELLVTGLPVLPCAYGGCGWSQILAYHK